MAMTNNMIILMERVKLMEDGVIGTTGRMFEIEDAEGNKKIIQEPEPIYTYAAWKSLGYQVRRGEKHIAEIDIWKMGKSKKSEDDGENEGKTERKRMFWKKAFFFKASQVEKVIAV